MKRILYPRRGSALKNSCFFFNKIQIMCAICELLRSFLHNHFLSPLHLNFTHEKIFFLFLFLFLVILFLFFSLSLFTLSYAFLCRRPCSNITETKITDDTIIPHPHAPARFIPSLTHPHTRPLSPGLLPRSLNPVIPYFRFPPTCFCPSGPPPPISLPSHHTPTTPPRGLRTIFTCISPKVRLHLSSCIVSLSCLSYFDSLPAWHVQPPRPCVNPHLTNSFRWFP